MKLAKLQRIQQALDAARSYLPEGTQANSLVDENKRFSELSREQKYQRLAYCIQQTQEALENGKTNQMLIWLGLTGSLLWALDLTTVKDGLATS